MNSNSILKSNLLDIIFDNRNKEYGAYVLRRDYNKRLLKSLLGMMALIAMFAIWMLQKHKPQVLNFHPTIIVDPLPVLPPPQIIKPSVPHTSVAPIIHASVPDAPPVISPDDKTDKTPPTNQQILVSVQGDYKDGPPSDNPVDGTAGKSGTEKKDLLLVKTEVPKEAIEAHPGIPASYPGGINEFIKFLKKNLRSPQDIEDDAVITVRVKFVVTLDGDLLSFNVIETGGDAFDNEVIRVLKKMPKWIPGKSNGEKVSSYYTLPVKFTAEK